MDSTGNAQHSYRLGAGLTYVPGTQPQFLNNTAL
jgi:hypothetical protein